MSSLRTTDCDSFILIDHVSHERVFASQKTKRTKWVQSNLYHPDLLSFVLPSHTTKHLRICKDSSSSVSLVSEKRTKIPPI
jgi:hypothetical protein